MAIPMCTQGTLFVIVLAGLNQGRNIARSHTLRRAAVASKIGGHSLLGRTNIAVVGRTASQVGIKYQADRINLVAPHNTAFTAATRNLQIWV